MERLISLLGLFVMIGLAWLMSSHKTYALSGFSNLGAIGIQIGGIGGLAPSRRSDLARLGLRAMIGGALACCVTACAAGVLI